MELEQAIFKRKSTRKFLDLPVDEKDLALILKAGAYAPSAMNNQDRTLTAITNKELLKKVNEIVYQISDTGARERIKGRCKGNFDCMYNASVLILVTVSKNAYMPIQDGSVALENMFLMAQDLGYGSCWINQLFGHNDCSILRDFLSSINIPCDHIVIGCCALGRADNIDDDNNKEKKNNIVILK